MKYYISYFVSKGWEFGFGSWVVNLPKMTEKKMEEVRSHIEKHEGNPVSIITWTKLDEEE